MLVVDVDPGETGNSLRVELIAQCFKNAVANAFVQPGPVEPTGCLAWDWLNDPETNFGRCAGCRRLVSDCEKPFEIRGLHAASVVDGELLCHECAYLRRERLEAEAGGEFPGTSSRQ